MTDKQVDDPGGLSVTFLSRIHEILCVTRIGRRAALPLLQRAGRIWVPHTILRPVRPCPDDVTVVIGVRNRADHRLANSLRSIRGQTYPAHLLRTVVVDYGSEPEHARRTERLCAEHGAAYMRVSGVSVWSRSRCLNVGLRRAATKFVLTSDVDILFSPGYVAGAVGTLRLSSLSYVCSSMLDLPEASAGVLERTARTGEALQLDTWKDWCRPRLGWEQHPSVCMTYTALLRAVRGYDEYYEGWGWEDEDLARRLERLGARRALPGSGSFYLHQWHPEWERGRDGANALRVERNRLHFVQTQSIVRNDRNWGNMPPAEAGSSAWPRAPA